MADKFTKAELLSKEPINWNGLLIYKPTLAEISTMGFARYNHITAYLTMSIFDIGKFLESQLIGGDIPDPIIFVIDTANSSPINFLEIEMGFFTYVRKPIEIVGDTIVIKDNSDKHEDFVLNQANFNEFQEILLMINRMYDVEDEREIHAPDGPMKQKFIQSRLKLREAKKKAAEKRGQDGDGITLPDIISAVCAYGIGYTMFNVWDLTIYQLYETFERRQAKEEFEHDYSALLAGADKKKIKLKNWIK